ncbi:hypothetical protein V8068_001152 [Vibrio parahaemolyticus]|nr:hypothetical protein [Vibrio parahaemolyticus]EHV9720298.1 hypothetical protein [Vibrio parahaemolyticus]
MIDVTKINKQDHPFWRFWRGLEPSEKTTFADLVGSSINTLRQIPEYQVSTTLAKRLSEETGIDKHYFRPDVWDLPQEGQSTTD